jgi:hypothetical protein
MINWIVQGVISLATNYIGYQKTKVELKRKVEIAKLETEADIQANKHEAQMAMLDADAYSEQARQRSVADEVIMIILAVFLVYAIIDPIGSKIVIETLSGFPLWLQIIYVGVLVSVFGLRGMFDSLGNVLKRK